MNLRLFSHLLAKRESEVLTRVPERQPSAAADREMVGSGGKCGFLAVDEFNGSNRENPVRMEADNWSCSWWCL